MSTFKEQPIPQGKYLPAVRHADLIFTSGMTPRKAAYRCAACKTNTLLTKYCD